VALASPDIAISYYQQTGLLPPGYTQGQINALLGIETAPEFYVNPRGERVAALSNGDQINLDTGQVYSLSIDNFGGDGVEKPILTKEEIALELEELRKKLGIGLDSPEKKPDEGGGSEGGGSGSGYYCSPDNNSEYCTNQRRIRQEEQEQQRAEEADEQYQEFLDEQEKAAEEAAYDPYDPSRPEYDRTLVQERDLQQLAPLLSLHNSLPFPAYKH
jgi:hypothetical protein